MPAPSSQGYKINMIGGANDMMAGTGTELAVECPDDYTLVVNLDAAYGDFLMQVCDPSTAPVPAGCADTDEDYQKFRVSPIGNGPFKMNGEWVDGQYIPLVRNDDYWGEKPFIDGVTFMIFSNDQTAWTEFQAGNLDFTQVPSGMFDLSRQMYGEAEKDGYLANPDHSYFSGSEISIYYILCNNKDEIMSNRDLRIAISCAINRQAICAIVFQGSRAPPTRPSCRWCRPTSPITASRPTSTFRSGRPTWMPARAATTRSAVWAGCSRPRTPTRC